MALLPAPRLLPLPVDDAPELCSHAEQQLQTPGAVHARSCKMCVRRRGRLLNPGGTLCCNQRSLARCPRLWD